MCVCVCGPLPSLGEGRGGGGLRSRAWSACTSSRCPCTPPTPPPTCIASLFHAFLSLLVSSPLPTAGQRVNELAHERVAARAGLHVAGGSPLSLLQAACGALWLLAAPNAALRLPASAREGLELWLLDGFFSTNASSSPSLCIPLLAVSGSDPLIDARTCSRCRSAAEVERWCLPAPCCVRRPVAHRHRRTHPRTHAHTYVVAASTHPPGVVLPRSPRKSCCVGARRGAS